MAYANLPLPDRFLAANLAITNSMNDPTIMARMAAASYDAARMAEGRALYETARDQHQQLLEARGDVEGAHNAFEAQWDAARDVYVAHLERARRVFKRNPDILKKLGAKGRRQKRLGQWLLQARQFYQAVLGNDEIREELETYGLPRAALEAGIAAVDAVEAASQAREDEESTEVKVIDLRDQAVDEMDGWVIDYFGLARQVLADSPHLLEKIGLGPRA